MSRVPRPGHDDSRVVMFLYFRYFLSTLFYLFICVHCGACQLLADFVFKGRDMIPAFQTTFRRHCSRHSMIWHTAATNLRWPWRMSTTHRAEPSAPNTTPRMVRYEKIESTSPSPVHVKMWRVDWFGKAIRKPTDTMTGTLDDRAQTGCPWWEWTAEKLSSILWIGHPEEVPIECWMEKQQICCHILWRWDRERSCWHYGTQFTTSTTRQRMWANHVLYVCTLKTKLIVFWLYLIEWMNRKRRALSVLHDFTVKSNVCVGVFVRHSLLFQVCKHDTVSHDVSAWKVWIQNAPHCYWETNQMYFDWKCPRGNVLHFVNRGFSTKTLKIWRGWTVLKLSSRYRSLYMKPNISCIETQQMSCRTLWGRGYPRWDHEKWIGMPAWRMQPISCLGHPEGAPIDCWSEGQQICCYTLWRGGYPRWELTEWIGMASKKDVTYFMSRSPWRGTDWLLNGKAADMLPCSMKRWIPKMGPNRVNRTGRHGSCHLLYDWVPVMGLKWMLKWIGTAVRPYSVMMWIQWLWWLWHQARAEITLTNVFL